jgi:hypothetical protein
MTMVKNKLFKVIFSVEKIACDDPYIGRIF